MEDDPFQYMRRNEKQPLAPSHLGKDLTKAFDGWNMVRVKKSTPLSVDMFPQQHREVWVDLFIKHNTHVTSSTAVERLFSLGSDVFRPKWSFLTDDNFEKLVFVYGHTDLLKGKWLCQMEEEEDNNI